jgi:hypothetical protein
LKLIKVDDGPVLELKDIFTGVYSLKLAATRAGCGPKVGAEGTPRWLSLFRRLRYIPGTDG